MAPQWRGGKGLRVRSTARTSRGRGSPSSTVENRASGEFHNFLNDISPPDALPSAMLDTYFRSPTPLSLYLLPDPCSLWPRSRARDIPPIAKPSGNRSYSSNNPKKSHCTVVLLPDGPTMMRWQGPTSPVHITSTISTHLHPFLANEITPLHYRTT